MNCKQCGAEFHSCSNCGFLYNWESSYCSFDCWKQSEGYDPDEDPNMEGLSLKEYQDFVVQMASSRSKRDWESMILTAGLGMASEAGEAADRVKKHVFHEGEWDRDAFLKEAGDVLWYIAFGAHAAGSSIREIINLNVEKLRARYTSGTFTKEEFEAKEKAKSDDTLQDS